jgi:hypothetical protein
VRRATIAHKIFQTADFIEDCDWQSRRNPRSHQSGFLLSQTIRGYSSNLVQGW